MIFAMCVKGYRDQENPEARFIFEANNPRHADYLRSKWTNYQGLTNQDVISRFATSEELKMRIHNDYLV